LEKTARASTPEPKFVYAHFLRGHPPYASDSSGNKFVVKPATIEEAYIQQVAWCNQTIKSVTDKIIANAKRPLVIIIQGDHGYQVYESPTDERKLAVFHAVYFSNGNYQLYPDSVTNVNTFRIVLNTFFNKNYPMLEDHGYFIR
jgi:phosphoglycerol transferase MdoB-like AlkP superfamily enzyme